MRLIDAGNVMKELKVIWERDHTAKVDIGKIICLIGEQPTAYDVDKVMNEFAEFAECSSECASTFYEGLGCGACIWSDVFNIVKRGGVDD